MKKILLILLVLSLLMLSGCACRREKMQVQEEPVYESVPESEIPLDMRLPGDWYASYEGLMLTLSLTDDGAYTLNIPGQSIRSGEWAIEDSALVLSGEKNGTLLPVAGILRWEAENLLFRREMPETYQPAEIYANAVSGDFDGYWKSHYVAVGDGTMLASALGEKTDVYVEGTRVALGGPLFGDVIVDMELKDGTLIYTSSGVSVTLALQEDGFMRLTMDADEDVTLYLLSAANEVSGY